MTVQSSTIAGNSANEGGGIATTDGSASIVDTIVAANTAPNGGADVNGTLDSLGNNLIGNPAGATGLTARDLVGLNPDLGPLQNNGGPTPTMALLPGSPAIDAGTTTSTLATDQRGLTRVINGASDIGAFELQIVAPTADAGNAYTIHSGDSLTLNALDSTDLNGDTLTYSWDINGDGTFGDAVGATPTLTWAQLTALGIEARTTPYLVRVMVSDGYGPSHQIISAPVTLTVLPKLQVIAPAVPATSIALPHVTKTALQPVNEVTVTFAAAVNPSSFKKRVLTLTRNGGRNLINRRVTIVAVPARRQPIASWACAPSPTATAITFSR